MLKISKKSLLIQLIIALVAVVGIFAVVYFTKPAKVEAPIVTPVVDTSDWKTYRNEKYGFEFKYPQEWLIEDNLGSNQCCLNIFDGARNKIQIQYYKNESLSGETLYIDDVKIIKNKSNTFEDALIYYIPLGNSQGLRYLFWNKDELYTKIAEKIISTFKFSTPVIVPAPATSIKPVACTMDAIMCPDGSYVGRTGPKCEFVCPVKEKCPTPLAYDDKKNISISCVEGIYTPDQVITLAEKLNGNQIEIQGYISSQPAPGPMPTAGPAFHTSSGNIFMNGVSGVYGVDKSKKANVRGVFSHNGKDNYFLTIPIYCKDCVKQL